MEDSKAKKILIALTLMFLAVVAYAFATGSFNGSLMPIVITTGLLDGINPCAFGVMLFLIAFLYTINKTRANVLLLGIVYISMIYIVYVLIGLGILKAIMIFSEPHFMARISAVFSFILGLINLKDYFWYGKGPTLRIPMFSKGWIVELTHKATLPATIILGILVGLCEFPCSGGIYVAILGMLALKTKAIEGLIYLLIYNVMFVLPLLIILAFASNKKLVIEMEKWDVKNKKLMKLVGGLVMILLAALIWFMS